MNKKQLFTYSKVCMLGLMGSGALLLASCAEDGFDDETFSGGVSNAQVESVSADDITISASADGKSQTISWPVVMGAGGYRVTLIDAGNPDEPIINDSIVDGCSVTASRDEDVNYQLTILALGNTKRNNTDAATAATKQFSTFTPTYATIPAGSELSEWFAQNPIPADSIGHNLNFDLEAGAEYTLAGLLDFDGQSVTLRSNSKSDHAKIVYSSDQATITFTSDFYVKYLDFDCSGMAANMGVFAFSKSSAVEKANVVDAETYKWTGPYFDKVVIANSNFDHVNGYFFWDNSTKTGVKTMLIDNCVVRLTPPAANAGGVIWTNKAGHINDFTVTSSTFYEDPDWAGDYKYFYQAGGVSAHEVYNSDATTNSVNYLNSTFYHIAWNNGQWGNYNRMQGRQWSYWVMTDCIFYDCSTSGSVPRRFLHGQAYATKPENKTFNNNTYMKNDGTFQDPQSYDESGTIIEEDPLFANPAAGDFHISGATQVARKTGDPRWLP
ncbi:MAG: DUF4957 domain-containing protein [Prevotella sp.]|nr:DUF4957 domain-containing protein [Prevotella sp.]